MFLKIAFVLFSMVLTVSAVSGQTKALDARTLLIELGNMLTKIPETKEDCQTLLNQIKAWQQKKLKELEAPKTAVAHSLAGIIGSSSRWGSGWLDLSTKTDFVRGDRLRLKIGGTAARILVRLLPKGISPESPQRIIGGGIIVPENRIVEVSLETDYKGIIQISVHGGPNPWDIPLGINNGPATIEAAELIRNNR